MVAGAMAGIIAMSSTYHLDMVRGRLTVQEGFHKQQYRGILHAYQEIVSKVCGTSHSSLFQHSDAHRLGLLTKHLLFPGEQRRIHV